MTQEERKQRREQETRNAATVLIGISCIVAAVVLGIVLLLAVFLKKDDKKPVNSNTEATTDTETETEEIETETETEEPVIDPQTQQAIATVSGMTLEQKVAQMFIITPDALTGVNGATVTGNTSKNAYEKYPVGGLIYMSKNLTGTEQTKDMLSKMEEFAKEKTGLSLFMGVDEESGALSRIASNRAFGVAELGKASEIGAMGEAAKAYELGSTIGNYLYDLGFNMDFAPVADVLTNSENVFLKDRSFGSDSGNVSNMVLSMLQGLEENNIYGVVKHFPGHGSTKADSHDGLATCEKNLEEMKQEELVPFQNAINNGADFIMVGHITVPNITGSTLPSSMSEYMITEVLRNQMGFDGVVITDAMNMKAITNQYDSAEAAITAINAGADIILMPADFKAAYEGVIEAVKSGTISEETINSAVVRIVKAKQAM